MFNAQVLKYIRITCLTKIRTSGRSELSNISSVISIVSTNHKELTNDRTNKHTSPQTNGNRCLLIPLHSVAGAKNIGCMSEAT